MGKLPKPDQIGKIKVRIIELEMEGSDDSLQEGLKSLAAALNRASTPASQRVRSDPAVRRIEANGATVDMPLTDAIQDVEEADAELEDAPQATAPRQRQPRKPAKVVTPIILQDVRFDDVSPTFTEFANDKNPKGDLQRYLVVGYWLKFYKQIEELTISHFYTAYKLMNWTVPVNVVQPMRELAATRDGRFSKGSEKGMYKINHIGENAVVKLGGGA